MPITAPDADQLDLRKYFRELDRVRRIAFARGRRACRDGMDYATRMKAYQEKLDLYHFGLNTVEPKKPRRMRIAKDDES